MTWQIERKKWLEYLRKNDPQLLLEMEEQSEQEGMEAFAGKMAFGTGGLRSVLGVGPARMNVYTVARATQGLAQAILAGDATKTVGIAYDTRKNSDVFARAAAEVLMGNGIKVVLWPQPVPTPVLSYTVRKLGLGWGIVITASHNPKQYNGYKVYDQRGVQVIPEQAKVIMEQIDTVEFFENPSLPLEEGEKQGLLARPDGLMESFLDELYALLPRTALTAEKAKKLPVVYSGLHGTGAIPVSTMLKKQGFENLTCIQMNPDSNFGGLYMPNPEDPRVYAEALKVAEKTGAKMLMATDPDCDRVGVQVLSDGKFVALNGNQIGALLIDYLLTTRREQGTLQPGETMVTTIVSGMLGQRIAQAGGVDVQQVLTGFKFIGDKAEGFPAQGRHFFFGYEESYGYLTGDLARDKDAVLAVALVAEMAVYYNEMGKNLYQRLMELYEQYGYYVESTISKSVAGLDFMDKIAAIMSRFRDPALDKLGDLPILAVEDYAAGTRTEKTGAVAALDVPKADVLKLFFEMGTLAVRPSGTEPNIKFYCSVSGKTLQQAQDNLAALRAALDEMIG